MGIPFSVALLQLAAATAAVTELAWLLSAFFLGIIGGFFISALISFCMGPHFLFASVLHGVDVFVFLVVLPAWLAR